eukprot:scaffold84278_cov35-Tisochrysis_lutea.AAC.7
MHCLASDRHAAARARCALLLLAPCMLSCSTLIARSACATSLSICNRASRTACAHPSAPISHSLRAGKEVVEHCVRWRTDARAQSASGAISHLCSTWDDASLKAAARSSRNCAASTEDWTPHACALDLAHDAEKVCGLAAVKGGANLRLSRVSLRSSYSSAALVHGTLASCVSRFGFWTECEWDDWEPTKCSASVRGQNPKSSFAWRLVERVMLASATGPFCKRHEATVTSTPSVSRNAHNRISSPGCKKQTEPLCNTVSSTPSTCCLD